MLAKIFGVLVITVLAIVGASNDDTVVFALWPFDFGLSMTLGLCLALMFLFSFLSGGLYMWLSSGLKCRKHLKEAKAKIKELEKRIKDAE